MDSKSSSAKPIGPYSPCVAAGDFLFVSGQIGEALPDITDATWQCIGNIIAILESQNMKISDVVKTTVFLRNLNDFEAMNSVYAQSFVQPYPARSTIEVSRLPKNALVEIECVAYRGV